MGEEWRERVLRKATEIGGHLRKELKTQVNGKSQESMKLTLVKTYSKGSNGA